MKWIAILILSLLVGCGQQAVDTQLDVALILPLSGQAAQVGEDFLKGMQLAHDDKSIVLHIEDDMSQPKNSVTGLNKLLDQQDIDIVVSMRGANAAAMIPTIKQQNLPFLVTLVASRNFTRRSDLTYQLYPLPSDEINELRSFFDARNYTSVASLSVIDEFGETVVEELEKEFEMQYIAREKYQITDVDYRTQITKLRRANPDVVYVIGYPHHLISFLKQRDELGWEVPVVGTPHIQSNFVRSQASEHMNEVYAVVPTAALSSNEEFAQSFQAAYNTEPDFLAPLGYDMLNVLESLDKSSPIDSLRHLSYEGLNGNLSFNQYGEVVMPLVMITASDRVVVN